MFSLMGSVAAAGEVNFTAFPNQLMDRLLLPNLYVARLLATLIVLMICLIPFAIFGKFLMTFIVGMVALFFCTSIGWIDGWIMIVITMIVSGLWSFGVFKNMLGGD